MTRHDGGNSVFVDELGMAIAAQQHAEIIEPRDDALQLYAVHQENGRRRPEQLCKPNLQAIGLSGLGKQVVGTPKGRCHRTRLTVTDRPAVNSHDG